MSGDLGTVVLREGFMAGSCSGDSHCASSCSVERRFQNAEDADLVIRQAPALSIGKLQSPQASVSSSIKVDKNSTHLLGR